MQNDTIIIQVLPSMSGRLASQLRHTQSILFDGMEQVNEYVKLFVTYFKLGGIVRGTISY